MANKKYTLLENFEYKGIWWLPNKPAAQVSGVLTFKNEEEISLELIGSFRDITSFGKYQPFQPEIILGITDNGKICTLYRNYETRSQLNFPGIIKSTFEAQYLFVDKHFNTADEIIFSSIKANFTNLENWMGQQPFETTITEAERAISYSFPEKFEVELPDSKVQSTFEYSTAGELFKKVEWTHTAFLEIIPTSLQAFEYYRQKLHDLNNLLTLLIGQTTYLKQIVAYGNEIEIMPGKKTKESIDVYYSQKKPNVKEGIHPFEMIVPLPRILNEISNVINQWFSNAETLRSVYDLFFGTGIVKSFMQILSKA